jgi:cyanuric acid amidohydrolase
VPYVVKKIPFEAVDDTSGLLAAIEAGEFTADQIVAVVGKTEGNGGVNDFSRILADRVMRDFLVEHGTRDRAAARQVPVVWSGGCDGVIAPHMTVFAAVPGPDDGSAPAGADDLRLTVGVALSEPILPEEVGRPAMVEKVAAGVRLAMADAGIDDPADVHFVQTKTPLLTMRRIEAARGRGQTVVTEETMDSMAISNATAALGIGVAVGEIDVPRADQIAKDLDVYCSVASCSSGVEQDEAQIVVVGNKRGVGGDFRIGHSVMRDAIDADGIYDAIRSAGLALPDRPRAADLGDALVNCFIKCEADPSGRLRGRRLVSLNDSDIHHTHHAKAATGAVAAAAIGDPAVFCSVASLQQGPAGGGMVAAIVDTSKAAAGAGVTP